jgi:hypothetical protein
LAASCPDMCYHTARRRNICILGNLCRSQRTLAGPEDFGLDLRSMFLRLLRHMESSRRPEDGGLFLEEVRQPA